jgi:hypothetical protein
MDPEQSIRCLFGDNGGVGLLVSLGSYLGEIKG